MSVLPDQMVSAGLDLIDLSASILVVCCSMSCPEPQFENSFLKTQQAREFIQIFSEFMPKLIIRWPLLHVSNRSSIFFLPNDPSIFCTWCFCFPETNERLAQNMFAFLIYGRHIFYAQEKKHPEEAVGIFSLFSCCPSLVNLVNIQGTDRTCGSSQSSISWRLFNSAPHSVSLSRCAYSMRNLLSTILPCLSCHCLNFSSAL